MRARYHVIVSLSGGAIIYLLTRSLSKAILFSIAGIFIDLDHLFDYIRNYGWKIISFPDFFKIFYTFKLKRIYVFLHSYELFLFLGLFLWYFKIDWGWAVFLGLSIHLLMDQIYYFISFREGSRRFYFLTYRISRGFETERFKMKF